MNQYFLQQQIFDAIIQHHKGRQADAVERVSAILNLSKDAVYRRIRCDTALLLHEVKALALDYRISLDAIVLGQTNGFMGSFNAFSRKITDFSDFLNGLLSDFQVISHLPNPRFYYASVEIPIFTYLFIPELFSFKLYVWGRTTWNLPFLENRPFDFTLVTPPIHRLGEQVLDFYLKIDSTELWSINIVDITLAQIEYHAYSGGFRNNSDALLLCDKLTEWTEHLKSIAKCGKKFRINEKPESGRAALHLYYNEMVHTNNAGLMVTDEGKMLYSAYCNPNFIKSTDTRLCNYTEEWFQNVIGKSIMISASSEKNRDWFFNELNRKIERVKGRINHFFTDL